jgi:hypothetical protein
MVNARFLSGILFLLLFFNFSFAQESKNTITNSGWLFGVGGISLYDEYLSPLIYTGTVFRADYQSSRFISAENNRIYIDKILMVSGGLAKNAPQTNSLFYISLRPGIGMHYHFRPAQNLKLLVGGLWDLSFASKYNFNNGNNPYSADLSTQLRISSILQYRFNLWKIPVLSRYETRLPVMGVMFVPEYGASYYEMFTLGHLGKAIHLSSPFNAFSWNNSVSADLLFKKFILRFSYTHDYEKHHANSLHFESIQNVFSVGSAINFSVFDRSKRPAPASYNDINL